MESKTQAETNNIKRLILRIFLVLKRMVYRMSFVPKNDNVLSASLIKYKTKNLRRHINNGSFITSSANKNGYAALKVFRYWRVKQAMKNGVIKTGLKERLWKLKLNQPIRLYVK